MATAVRGGVGGGEIWPTQIFWAAIEMGAKTVFKEVSTLGQGQLFLLNLIWYIYIWNIMLATSNHEILKFCY